MIYINILPELVTKRLIEIWPSVMDSVTGLPRNMDEAIKWYQKSASKYDLIQVDEIKEQIEKERAKEREKNSVISS